jgi:hypothetical protein
MAETKKTKRPPNEAASFISANRYFYSVHETLRSMPAIALGVAWAETGADVLALAAELERATGSAQICAISRRRRWRSSPGCREFRDRFRFD